MPTRRQFLSLSGIAAAAVVLGACAPAREVVERARGHETGFAAPPLTTDETWRMLNRLTFAPRAHEIARANEIGVHAWMDEQLAPETIDDLDCELRTRGLDTLWMDPDLILNVRYETAKQELQQAALVRAIYSKRQLYESMVEFWGDHFNIAQDKLDCAWLKTVDDREVIRKYALGNFHDLLWASMHSPAMLHYLDNQDNFRDSPNENYARELLELHSLGVDAGYTQHDVRETARALTGWTVNQTWRRGRFEFNADQHQETSKTVLGVKIPANGGERDGQLVFDAICAHPALAHFISRKLVRRFVADDPPLSLVAKTASAFVETRGDIRAMLRAIMFSDEFTSAPPKYKRPLHFVAGALRQLNIETNGRGELLEHLARMGQPLFQWAMPDGFPDRANAWQNNLIPRWQFAMALATDELGEARISWEDLERITGDGSMSGTLQKSSTLLLGGELPGNMAERVASSLGSVPNELHTREAVAVLLASPQYQWR